MLLKKAPTMANVQLKVPNRYSIFEKDNTEEGHVIHTAVDNNIFKNNLCEKISLLIERDLRSKIRLLRKQFGTRVISKKHTVARNYHLSSPIGVKIQTERGVSKYQP
jgi:hypothetical protein